MIGVPDAPPQPWRANSSLMLKLIALLVPLGLDTFVVSAAVGATGLPARRRMRVSALFMLFEDGMPLVGLGLGASLSSAIGSGAEYVAIAMLLALGIYVVLFEDEEAEEQRLAHLAGPLGIGTMLLGLADTRLWRTGPAVDAPAGRLLRHKVKLELIEAQWDLGSAVGGCTKCPKRQAASGFLGCLGGCGRAHAPGCGGSAGEVCVGALGGLDGGDRGQRGELDCGEDLSDQRGGGGGLLHGAVGGR